MLTFHLYYPLFPNQVRQGKETSPKCHSPYLGKFWPQTGTSHLGLHRSGSACPYLCINELGEREKKTCSYVRFHIISLSQSPTGMESVNTFILPLLSLIQFNLHYKNNSQNVNLFGPNLWKSGRVD
jgi:hypothetical protein